jgi:hypothetical protein
VFGSGSNSVPSSDTAFKKFVIQKSLRESAMARAGLGNMPRGTPCAQCSKPIASPDWIEQGAGRISYLWTCRACHYRFEAIAILDARAVEPEPIAA